MNMSISDQSKDTTIDATEETEDNDQSCKSDLTSNTISDFNDTADEISSGMEITSSSCSIGLNLFND